MKRIDEERKPLQRPKFNAGTTNNFKLRKTSPIRPKVRHWFCSAAGPNRGWGAGMVAPGQKNTENNPMQSTIFVHTKCNFWVIFLTCPWWLAVMFTPICG